MRQHALADFDASLKRIRDLANSIVSTTSDALTNVTIRELHETQQCGAVVLLSGYFEAFLKDLVRRYIDGLSSSGVAFTGLPKVIRNKHFEGGGRVLSKAVECARNGKVPPLGNASPEDIVARLYSTSNAGGSYEMVWEAFADTRANPGPDVVKEIARGLGVKEFWPTVAMGCGDPARWSDTALTTKLDDLIAKRNACAHTGTVTPIPTASDILDFADMLQAIGEGFVTTLEAELAVHKTGIAATGPSHSGGRKSRAAAPP